MAVWKPVVGFEGYYEVSDVGEVRSLDRVVKTSTGNGERPVQSRVMRQQSMTIGYKVVSLAKDGQRKRATVHRLVLFAFRGEPPFPEAQCRHLNGVAWDNRLENLAWGTHAENAEDIVNHGNYQTRKTHCPHGHEYTPENTYWTIVTRTGRRQRVCKTCANTKTNARYAANHKRERSA